MTLLWMGRTLLLLFTLALPLRWGLASSCTLGLTLQPVRSYSSVILSHLQLKGKRLEAVLAAIEGDPAGKAITFSSGLSALVALLFALSPR